MFTIIIVDKDPRGAGGVEFQGCRVRSYNS